MWLGTLAGLSKMMASVLPQQGTEFSQQVEVDPEPQKRITALADTLTSAGETEQSTQLRLPGLPARRAHEMINACCVEPRSSWSPVGQQSVRACLTEGQAGFCRDGGEEGSTGKGSSDPYPWHLG